MSCNTFRRKKSHLSSSANKRECVCVQTFHFVSTQRRRRYQSEHREKSIAFSRDVQQEQNLCFFIVALVVVVVAVVVVK